MALSSFHVQKLQALFDKNDVSGYAHLGVALADVGENALEAAPEVFGDEYMDFHFQAMAQYFETSRGELYAAALLDKDGVYKVGMTGKTAAQRQKTLNTAGVLAGLHMVKSVSVHDRFWAEKRAHALLAPYWVKGEFFQIKYAELFSILEWVGQADATRKAKICQN